MSDFPKLGMEFEDVRGRIKKYKSIKKGNRNMYKSLLRQAALHEGEPAMQELHKEHQSYSGKRCNNGASNRLGYSPQYHDSYSNIQW